MKGRSTPRAKVIYEDGELWVIGFFFGIARSFNSEIKAMSVAREMTKSYRNILRDIL